MTCVLGPIPALDIAAAKVSGAGSGCRPGPWPRGAARSVSTSRKTAPGMCASRYALRPLSFSTSDQRTSATRRSGSLAWSASHSHETRSGAFMAPHAKGTRMRDQRGASWARKPVPRTSRGGVRRPLPRRRSLAGEDPLDLPQVVEVVASEHPNHVLDRLLPALGMHSEVLPLLGRQRPEQREVPFPQHAKQLDRLPRLALVVVSAHGPLVLVIGKNGRARGTENQPKAKRADDLGIGQMRDDVAHGPFLRAGALAQCGDRDAFDQALQLPGGGSLHRKRLLAVHVTQDALRVLLRGFIHLSPPNESVAQERA